ncbi:hypothetical protein QNO08_12710 [Arthrobacter sp. zg-Y820]|uniref:hypothetical protein n=1 Tax=unclassified Arthrobacter TaxID=235627 RepID=UPI001E35D070|nr:MULTISPECIES: hypothetical protein [unclassified Arthrobacter]MCC9196031.1 hypothetical protein [Arthrobacter sp. zg-Y820]MDK1278890.1 hypothetical protein [Arthrobacter sp. zg.Y820]MDK1359495.1 hypothetical protein [Arthrobacter sp. zg-Y1219]WIB08695.1 hypothetical protein QNO08_12710 [Arthrobacter sp. zg-Y820]
MSGTFWALQPEENVIEEKRRTPLWAWAVTTVNLLIALAVIPVVILVVVPFFFVYYIYLASLLVWIAPVLVAANAVLFVWALKHKAAGQAALSILGVFFAVISWVVLKLWEMPIIVLGIRF